MEYKQKNGSPWPGHIIFLIDQSGSMSNLAGTITRLELAQNWVTASINDIILGCISGEDTLNRCYISVIGYGNKGDSVELIRHGWVSEWEEDVMACKFEGKPLFSLECSNGRTPMAGAFKMAQELLESWHEKIEMVINNPKALDSTNKERPIVAMGLPIVINITDGCLIESGMVNVNIEETVTAATNLMNVYDSDGGKVFLFNVYIGEQDVFFPLRESLNITESRAVFLYDACSELTEEMAERFRYIESSLSIEKSKYSEIVAGCKGVVSINQAKFYHFIEMLAKPIWLGI